MCQGMLKVQFSFDRMAFSVARNYYQESVYVIQFSSVQQLWYKNEESRVSAEFWGWVLTMDVIKRKLGTWN